MNTFQKLTSFLRDRQHKIVKTVEVLTDDYNPTYGASVRTTQIDIIEFEALLRAIDEFEQTFEE